MPPRTRKTAATSPVPEEKATGGEVQSAEPVMLGDSDPEAFVPAAAAEPEPTAPVEPAPESAATPTLAYHWQQADGRPGSPCRVCAPAGPPAGAGSFGCGHGQWVLVAGDA